MDGLLLWYQSAARAWTEALPIGTGRLGAMVFGGLPDERLQINEDTLWTGGPYSPLNPDALVHLDEVRSLIFAGRFSEADAVANRHLMAKPLRQMSFQPAADVWIRHQLVGETTDYRRGLDLGSAVATTTFTSGGVTFTREAFASAVAGVIVVRVAADRPGSIDLAVSLTSPQPGALDDGSAGALVWRGVNREAEGVPAALRFAVKATVTARGGVVRRAGQDQVVQGADEVVIVIDAATSFRRFDDVGADPDASIASREAGWKGRPVDDLRAAHVADHRRFFDRLAIDLGRTPAADLPTDRRIAENPGRGRPGARGALRPVWPLPDACLFAAGHAAGQPSRHLERSGRSAVGQQVHQQHQPPDELLAARSGQPRGVHGAAASPHGGG